MSNNSEIKNWIDEVNELEFEEKYTPKSKIKLENKEKPVSRKRPRPDSKSESDAKTNKPPKKQMEVETDTSVLQRRQKQIDYGKNTVGYHNYMTQVAVEERTKDHPRTPDKYAKYSRRSWDALIKIWRKKLHKYDPSGNGCSDSDNESNNSVK